MDDLNLKYLDDARIDLYLNQQLDDSERDAFEIAMLEDPLLLQHVQLLESFKQGLHEHSGALQEPAAPIRLPLRAWIRQPLSLAASILVAGLGLQVLTTGLNSTQALPLRSVVVLQGTRGANPIAVSGAGPYLFQVDAGYGSGVEEYKLSLRNVANGALLMVQQNLRPDANGWLRVALDEQLQGDYALELAWEDAQGEAHTREYRVALDGGAQP